MDLVYRSPKDEPMHRANPLILTALLAGFTAACRDDSPDPTGPAPGSGQAAVAAAAPIYSVKNLGTLGGLRSAANAINNVGQTVGWADTRAGKTHAFIYQSGAMKDLGALAGGVSVAYDINDAGVVVGYSTLLSGAERAVRWQNGTKKNLGTLGGRNSQATAINESGVIVGWSETRSGDTHAFIYQNGVMKDIGTLGGKESRAWGINKAGKVVGGSRTASGKLHAFAWINGRFQDLGDNGTEFGVATAINSGRIVGEFGPPPDAEGGDLELVRPFIYAGGVYKVFNTRHPTSHAHDVNPDGIVVGGDEEVQADDNPSDAWVRQSGGTLQVLPELADGLASAQGINSFGTIVGYSEAADGWHKAVIWRPQ
jgi:probable HAF family extracellular repeat protein